MDTQTATLDSVRINNSHLVLISENRISFISNVLDEEIERACAEEWRVIVAHANVSTMHPPLGPSIAFMPTFDCNLRCIYCYARGGENQTSLPFAMAKHAIDWTASKTDDPHAKPLTVYFVGGGEPFMNFCVMDDICCYGRERFASVEVIVVSNGIHGRKQRQWLIENRVSTRISFDGVMHAKNRPLATHAPSDAIVEQTIEELVAAGVPLTVQLTITRDGTARMIESIERISSLGARYIKIEPVHHSVLSRGERSLVPNLEEFVEMFLSSLKWITEHDLPVKIDNLFISRPTSGYYCGAGEGSNEPI